jgi:hypothetical protein
MVPDVTIRVYGDLRVFVDADRDGEVRVPTGAPRSVKDVIESAGIPHPEVDLLLVDGTSVGFDHRVAGGERVTVFPAFHSIDVAPASKVRPPAPPARFVCDVHLGRLARRLRLLGFDTWYRTDTDDDELARVAVAEQRVLLTRDRGLLMRRVIVHGYCPRSDQADTQVVEVLRRYRLTDAIAPLQRCARCNGLIDAVDKAAVLDQLPPRTRIEHDRFARCASCGQVYWPGSHTNQIEAFISDARLGALGTAPHPAR